MNLEVPSEVADGRIAALQIATTGQRRRSRRPTTARSTQSWRCSRPSILPRRSIPARRPVWHVRLCALAWQRNGMSTVSGSLNRHAASPSLVERRRAKGIWRHLAVAARASGSERATGRSEPAKRRARARVGGSGGEAPRKKEARPAGLEPATLGLEGCVSCERTLIAIAATCGCAATRPCHALRVPLPCVPISFGSSSRSPTIGLPSGTSIE